MLTWFWHHSVKLSTVERQNMFKMQLEEMIYVSAELFPLFNPLVEIISTIADQLVKFS